MIRSLQVFVLLLGWLPLSVLAVDPEIRTPPAPPGPSINGPRVYGARSGRPFFYHLPVTGERPMKFGAHGLPAGLTIDPDKGNVTGTVSARGNFPVEFTAANGRGVATATVNLVIGDTICLTPPLGWNSWNHFAGRVTDKDVRDAADAMVNSGLIDHGWTYINVDDCWQGERDAAGNIHGNAKFPDMKALADYVHARGLKFGIYSSPGPKTCAGFAGSYGHEDQDARTYADWGVDYVKYDLCSYGKIIRDHPDTPPLEAQQTPYRVFGQSLAKVGRDIVYSFCQYGNANVWEWGASLGGNCWRTTGDIQANDEVLAVDQDTLGVQGYRREAQGTKEVWVKTLSDLRLAVALFNRGDQPAEVALHWGELRTGESVALYRKGQPMRITDLWRHKSLNFDKDGLKAVVVPHGAELIRID